jgi:hypothetical protein
MIFLFKAAKHAFFFEAGVSGADGATICMCGKGRF